MIGEVDLFGLPVDPGRGRPGRPRHMPTEALRRKVRRLHRQGLNHKQIGAAIGISDKTLELNYWAELESGSQAWRRRSTGNTAEESDD